MHQNKHPLSHNNRLELLAPAKNLAYGIEAINHGADAVYMGGPAFGAALRATPSKISKRWRATPIASAPKSLSPSTPCCTITSWSRPGG